MQIRCDIGAKQGKKACNSECFIAIPNYFKINRARVEVVREEGDDGVDRDHEKYSYDADGHQSRSVWTTVKVNLLPLFPWFQVMSAMSPYKVEGHDDRDEAKQCREYQAKMVEYQAMP